MYGQLLRVFVRKNKILRTIGASFREPLANGSRMVRAMVRDIRRHMLNYYIYDRIPGQHVGYSVAVLATSRANAKQYMLAVWGGGVFTRRVDAGEVKADFGAVTEAAAAVLRSKRQVDAESSDNK